MKIMKDFPGLPEEMQDIKEGRIFETPPDYFENLTDRLFDKEGHYRFSESKPTKILRLRPWLIAASIALIVAMAFWFTYDNYNTSTNHLTNASSLNDYIQAEIMEYDLEVLSANLNEIDLYSLSENDANFYEKYIEENLEDFDEIIFH